MEGKRKDIHDGVSSAVKRCTKPAPAQITRRNSTAEARENLGRWGWGGVNMKPHPVDGYGDNVTSAVSVMHTKEKDQTEYIPGGASLQSPRPGRNFGSGPACCDIAPGAFFCSGGVPPGVPTSCKIYLPCLPANRAHLRIDQTESLTEFFRHCVYTFFRVNLTAMWLNLAVQDGSMGRIIDKSIFRRQSAIPD